MYGTPVRELGSHKKSTYGFVNETAVRTGAAIMFTIGFSTFLSVLYAGKYHMAMVVVGFFWIDFLLKVIHPKYSFVGKVAGLLTKHKPVQRVGAVQKRFAWAIGLVLSGIVLSMLVYRNVWL